MVAKATRRYEPHADRGIGTLDLASAYLRANGGDVLGRYLLAMAPLFVAGWFWIDAVTAQDRSALPIICVFVLLAMLWRWAGLAWVQAAVMRNMGMAATLTPQRVAGAVLARLTGHVVMVWGGILLLPALWGFYAAAFSCIMMLDPDTRTGVAFKRGGKMVLADLGPLWKLSASMLVLVMVAVLSVVLVQVALLETVLPSLLGIDTTDLQLATRGPAWWLGIGFMIWAGFDLLWAVASVFEFNRMEASRSGADLHARLAWLKETA